MFIVEQAPVCSVLQLEIAQRTRSCEKERESFIKDDDHGYIKLHQLSIDIIAALTKSIGQLRILAYRDLFRAKLRYRYWVRLCWHNCAHLHF